ncbi:MAG: dihydrofolate reductase family protein [Chryseolinea sp.]
MRKLKLQVQMSLDGYVARPNGAGDWIWIGKQDPTILDHVIQLADTCDTILLGRKMTREFVDHWEKAYDNPPDNGEHPLAKRMVEMRKIVFSHTEKSIKGRNVEVENGDLVEAVTKLKKQPGKDIIVYGGASFVSSLISNNLIDEFYLYRRPIAIGSGMPIFKEQRLLELENTITFKNGAMLHKYLPATA